MKVQLLLLFLLFFGINADAQTYFDNNATWRFKGEVENWGCCRTDDYMYFVSGDSTFNGQLYQKLMRKGFAERWSCMSHGVCPDTTLHYEVLNSLVRQDGKKVYEVPVGDTAEHLLFNFDLQIGDSVFVIENTVLVGQVTFIDSILVNGTYNKRFSISDGMYSNVLIEGIGYVDLQYSFGQESDQFYPHDQFWVLYTDLLCYSEDGTPYFVAQGEECYFNLGEQHLVHEFDFVYAMEKDLLTINFEQEDRPSGVKIYNATAQEMNCSLVETSGQLQLNTADLNPGIYFVLMQWENDQSSFKIVVQ